MGTQGKNAHCVNADGDPSDEEFTPPIITLKEMSGARLELHKVLSAYCSQKPNYVSALSLSRGCEFVSLISPSSLQLNRNLSC